MWAARNGDIEKLTKTILVIGPKAEHRQLIVGFSTEAREKYAKPETLAASLLAGRDGRFVEIESAKSKITALGQISHVSVVLLDEDGNRWTKNFVLKAENAGWRVMTFNSEVAALIKGQPPAAPLLYRTPNQPE